LLETDAAEPGESFPPRIPDTVDSANPSVSAISAAVKRSRRNATSASTRSGAVRFAARAGAEERS
jgi:hypothetical protein